LHLKHPPVITIRLQTALQFFQQSGQQQTEFEFLSGDTAIFEAQSTSGN
jgi:hypothetical protein